MKLSFLLPVSNWGLCLLSMLSIARPSFAQVPVPASNEFIIEVQTSQPIGEMYPLWAYFGYDEPNYTYMADGRKIISELAELSPVPVYFRTHNLLNSDDGPRAGLKWGSTNAYSEDENGDPLYDWTVIDRIFDTYIDRGGKPLVEIGFMPKALSVKPEPYRLQWTADPQKRARNVRRLSGISYPPKDYEKWAELIYQWVIHSIGRYGKKEVESWWWEVWNEPVAWFMGSTKEYFKLYDYTVDAVKRALPAARVGGPTVANPDNHSDADAVFLKDFLEHCSRGTNYVSGKQGSSLDYITWHVKGRPVVVGDGAHVRMNMGRELGGVVTGFEIVNTFPEFKDLPIILGEVDPEGCAACPVEFYPQNAYRNGLVYASYTASSFARMYEMADQYDVNFKGAMSWSFIFEDQPWFAGFRSLATNGVDKPVLNVFRMFGMMDGDRLAIKNPGYYTVADIQENGVRGDRPDVHALASRKDDRITVMVWNYHDDDLPAADAELTLKIRDLTATRVLVRHYRIDDKHSNSYSTWLNMGAPQQVTREGYKRLEDSGQLEMLCSPKWMDVSHGTVVLKTDLPRHAVSLFEVEL